MDDDSQSKNSGGHGNAVVIAVVVAVLPVVYFLSIIPVALLDAHLSSGAKDFLRVFYWPLRWVHEHVVPLDFIEDLIEWLEGVF